MEEQVTGKDESPKCPAGGGSVSETESRRRLVYEVTESSGFAL